jgi:hypothetical protein
MSVRLLQQPIQPAAVCKNQANEANSTMLHFIGMKHNGWRVRSLVAYDGVFVLLLQPVTLLQPQRINNITTTVATGRSSTDLFSLAYLLVRLLA